MSVGPLDLFITVGCPDVGYQGLLPQKQVAGYFKYILDVPEGQIQQPFPCGELFWSDNFDSYTDGQYPLPSPWTIFWSGNPSGCRVTSEQSFSPPYSWRASDYSSWARYDAVPMTRKDHFCYEARIMLTQNYFPARIGFAWHLTGSTTGHFCAYGLSGAAFITNHWYHVYSEVDCVGNKWRLWLDDELKIDSEYTDETGENTFDSFFIGTGNHTSYPDSGVAYFDDIKFWVDQ
jgi:hypothetical protein